MKVYSSTNGQLDIDADNEIEITAPNLDIDASSGVSISNDLTVNGDIDLEGGIDVNGTTNSDGIINVGIKIKFCLKIIIRWHSTACINCFCYDIKVTHSKRRNIT